MSEKQAQELRLYKPGFDSPLLPVILNLNHLKKMSLRGSTHPSIFFQLKTIFQMLESVGSARIEGNRTTISEYIEQKIGHNPSTEERFSEIANVEAAMEYIEESINEGTEITHLFIRELHQLTVSNLDREGDRTPGAYRTWNVDISNSDHNPLEHVHVQPLMDELLAFINEPDAEQYDLIKIATAHHRFTWIHPFGNGNGRTVRLLTYAMLIKYGFNVKDGQILNPTAVFCNDREVYYAMLSRADHGEMEEWITYVLNGISHEIEKIHALLEHKTLLEEVLIPTLEHAQKRELITAMEFKVLKRAADRQIFKSGDLSDLMTQRQRTAAIQNLKEMNFIRPLKEGGREYIINFKDNPLMRSLFITLEEKGFIPAIN